MTFRFTSQKPDDRPPLAHPSARPETETTAKTRALLSRTTRVIRWSRTTRRPLLANASAHALAGVPIGYAAGFVIVQTVPRLVVGLSLALTALALGLYVIYHKARVAWPLSRSRPAL